MKNMLRIFCVLLAVAVALAGMPVLPAMSAIAEEAGLLTLPAALTVIEEEAFAGATAIGSVVVPEGTTAIEARAFADSSLTEITLPGSLESIASDAFEGCAAGLTVKAPEGSYAYEWALEMGYIEETPATPASDFSYSVSDGAVTITGYKGDATEIVIPASIDGAAVTAIGADAFFDEMQLTSVILPSTLTKIGSDAFYCSGIRTITIPASVTSIGSSAFGSCSDLSEIIVEEGNAKYKSVSGVLYNAAGTRLMCCPGAWNKGVLAIPEGVTTIDSYACRDADMTAVTIPASLTSFDSAAFDGCTQLASFTVDSANESICSVDGVLYNKDMTMLLRYPAGNTAASFTAPEGVTRIAEYSFSNSDNLESVILPDGVTYIGLCAFEESDNLRSVTMTDSVTDMDWQVFSNCPKLENVRLSDNITNIGNWCFLSCYSLKEIEIPASVTSIGNYAFRDCTSLTEVVIPEGVLSIGTSAFAECAIARITLPASLESISNSALNYNADDMVVVVVEGSYAHTWATGRGYTVELATSGPTEAPASDFTYITINGSVTILEYVGDGGDVVVPASLDGAPVKIIGNAAFVDNSALTSVVLPEGLTDIESMAFYSCDNLTSVTIPGTVSYIHDEAFDYCPKLIIYADEDSYAGAWTLEKGLALNGPSVTGTIDGFSYKIANGRASITGYTGEGGEVVVPATIEGVQVTAIADYAFNRNSSITSVTLPEGLLSIGDDAFNRCTALTSVSIPSTVSDINMYAFSNCTALTGFDVAEDNDTYMDEDGVLFTRTGVLQQYPAGKAGTVYEVPAGTTELAWYSFRNSSLVEVIVPASVYRIGETAFWDCPDLVSINVETGNSEYVSVDGVLFGGHGTQLNTYPMGRTAESYAVPAGVKAIGSSSFCDNPYLRNITLPDGVWIIYTTAFENCTVLESIVIPEGVTHMYWGAFYGCESLVSVTLPASLEEFNGEIFDENTNPDVIVYAPADSYAYEVCVEMGWNVVASENNTPDTPGDEDENVFTYTIADGEATITGYTGKGGDVVVPASLDGAPVTAIADDLFRENNTVTTVTLPASLASANALSFRSCENLTGIFVEDGSASLADVNGVLYTKDMATLICYPMGKTGSSFSIPESVKRVENDAIYGNPYLTQITIPYGVTHISNRSIAYLPNITQLEIPDSVVDVSMMTFAYCDSLRTVKLPSGLSHIDNYLFEGCAALTEITLPSTVESIGWNAFDGCASLKEIVIPEGVTTMKDSVFFNCSSLESVTLPASLESLDGSPFNKNTNPDVVVYAPADSYAYTYCTELGLNVCISGDNSDSPEGEYIDSETGLVYEIVNGKAYVLDYTGESDLLDIPATLGGFPVTFIAGSAFEGKTILTSVTVPEGVTVLGDSAFKDCTSLLVVTLPGSLTYLGTGAFANCTNLQYVETPCAFAELQSETFSGCTSLVAVALPETVTKIGDKAFENCSSLAGVYIPGGVTSIAYDAFDGTSAVVIYTIEGSYAQQYAGEMGFEVIAEAAKPAFTYTIANGEATITGYTGKGGAVEIPGTLDGAIVTAIGDYAFDSKTAVTSVAFPESLSSIGQYAFRGCTGLTSVELPPDVLTIGDSAFRDCANLSSFNPAPNMRTIGVNAFCNCSALESIDIPDQVTTIGSGAFFGCSSLSAISIPAGVSVIDAATFSGCTSLASLTLNDGLTVIGEEAFVSCSALTELVLPDTVVSVAPAAFFGCSGLKSIVISSGMEEILAGTFGECTSLQQVTIPASVQSIDGEAFYDCPEFTVIAEDGTYGYGWAYENGLTIKQPGEI